MAFDRPAKIADCRLTLRFARRKGRVSPAELCVDIARLPNEPPFGEPQTTIEKD
jgi:hypothetical protein